MCVIDTLNVQINTLLLAFHFFLSLTRDRLSLCLLLASSFLSSSFSFPHSLSPSASTLSLPLSLVSPLGELSALTPAIFSSSLSLSLFLLFSLFHLIPSATVFLVFFLSLSGFPSVPLSLSLLSLPHEKNVPLPLSSPSLPASQRIIQREGSHGVASNTQDAFVEFQPAFVLLLDFYFATGSEKYGTEPCVPDLARERSNSILRRRRPCVH